MLKIWCPLHPGDPCYQTNDLACGWCSSLKGRNKRPSSEPRRNGRKHRSLKNCWVPRSIRNYHNPLRFICSNFASRQDEAKGREVGNLYRGPGVGESVYPFRYRVWLPRVKLPAFSVAAEVAKFGNVHPLPGFTIQSIALIKNTSFGT